MTEFCTDITKFKAFADEKLNMAEMAEFVVYIVENIVEEGENAGYQHFLLSSSVL